jgi:hypothetical protein
VVRSGRYREANGANRNENSRYLWDAFCIVRRTPLFSPTVLAGISRNGTFAQRRLLSINPPVQVEKAMRNKRIQHYLAYDLGNRCSIPVRRSTFAVGDATLGQIIGREFHSDFVSGHDPNEKFTHATGHVGNHLVPSFDLNAKTRIG